MSIAKTLTLAALSLSVATGALADDIAITGGKVITMGEKGVIENATVLIKDGKITKVGEGLKIPKGYEVIDAKGKWVTPGFMGVGTGIGLGEGPSGAGADGRDQKAKKALELDVTWGINPEYSVFAVSRIEGITRVATTVKFTNSLFSGQGAVIGLDDDGTVHRSKAYFNINLNGRGASVAGSRSSMWNTVLDAMREADDHIKDEAKKAEEALKPKKSKKGDDKDDKKDAKKEKPNEARDAMVRMLKGEETLVVKASKKSDLLQVIRLKEKYPSIKMVIYGGFEAWRVADKLAAADIDVMLDTQANLPSFESLGATQQNIVRLEKAGVGTAIIPSDSDANVRLIIQSAGNAVANGMSWQGAMASLTTTPAQMFGIADSYGKIEKGMDADVVVWDGDPLEVMSSPTAVVIGGVNTALVSRQTKLRDRYLNPARSPAYVK